MIIGFDLQELYKTYFNNSIYHIAKKDSDATKTELAVYSGLPENDRRKGSIDYTIKNGQPLNKISAYGKDIWFPVTFWKSSQIQIEIEACTVNVNLVKTIIKTPVSDREGTVHEQFNVDDTKFSIKGFLIGKNQTFPERQIMALMDIFKTTDPVSLHGGYPELFLDRSCQVAIISLEFPEVQGKKPWIRPFNLICESDSIQDLIIK